MAGNRGGYLRQLINGKRIGSGVSVSMAMA